MFKNSIDVQFPVNGVECRKYVLGGYSMSKGKLYKSDLKRVKDDRTGVEVTRLTDNQGNTIHPYFTQPLFSEDGRFLLVSSDRTGSWQLYSLEIKTGNMVQLTDEADLGHHSACLDGRRMIAYYLSGATLKSVNLSNLCSEELYQAPEGFKPGSLSLTSDGQSIDFSYSEKLALSTINGKLYSGMAETLFRRPACVVMRVNLNDKSAKAIWGEREWISHVITSPIDRDIIVFCHEGPWHLVQRTWAVRASTSEIWPLIEQKRYLERTGHEFFTKRGRVVTQYGVRETPNSEWKCSDVFVYPDGTGMEKYDYPGPKPMHVQVNSTETLGVGDSAFLEPGFSEGNRFMSLIRYKDGKAIQKILCKHDTSWKTQYSHPHPIFTPDDSKVIFDSDREGGANVYMAPAEY